MVTAYKGVVKEKEALEASFKVLSASKSQPDLTKSAADNKLESSNEKDDRPQTDGSDAEGKPTQDPLNVSGTVRVSFSLLQISECVRIRLWQVQNASFLI